MLASRTFGYRSASSMGYHHERERCATRMSDLLADWGAEWGLDVGAARLAALAGMAGRVEAELLRAVRVRCLPGVDVSSEQAVWFSAIVNGRSEAGVSFAPSALRAI